MMNKAWFKAASVRALKTFCQSFLATCSACSVLGEVPWVTAISSAVLATLLSFLTSVAGLPEVKSE